MNYLKRNAYSKEWHNSIIHNSNLKCSKNITQWCRWKIDVWLKSEFSRNQTYIYKRNFRLKMSFFLPDENIHLKSNFFILTCFDCLENHTRSKKITRFVFKIRGFKGKSTAISYNSKAGKRKTYIKNLYDM